MTRERRSRTVADDDGMAASPVDGPATADAPVKPRAAARAAKAPAPAETSESPAHEPSEVASARTVSPRRELARSSAEAHDRYVAARDAWTAAMRKAASGRPADLAALALAQETYEEATAEWEHWESGERVAVAVQSEKAASVGTIVDQHLAWRKVQQHENRSGFLGRLTRRLRGR